MCCAFRSIKAFLSAVSCLEGVSPAVQLPFVHIVLWVSSVKSGCYDFVDRSSQCGSFRITWSLFFCCVGEGRLIFCRFLWRRSVVFGFPFAVKACLCASLELTSASLALLAMYGYRTGDGRKRSRCTTYEENRDGSRRERFHGLLTALLWSSLGLVSIPRRP